MTFVQKPQNRCMFFGFIYNFFLKNFLNFFTVLYRIITLSYFVCIIFFQQERGLDASLGRIYISDPDDWDLDDKTFSWAGSPHPMFKLNEETGILYASSHLREGRYPKNFQIL